MSVDSFRTDGLMSEMAAADPCKCCVETEKQWGSKLHSVPSSSALFYSSRERLGSF